MPHCVAVDCNIQAKNKQKDPNIRFHVFPKDEELRQAWIHAIGRTSLLANPRLCSKHFRMLNPLKTDAVSTLFLTGVQSLYTFQA